MPNKDERLVLWFDELEIADVPLVGGKNAALGEMYRTLVPLGVRVPNGFAISAAAYRHFFKETGLDKKVDEILKGLDTRSLKDLQKRAKLVREAIVAAELPKDLKGEIINAYNKLSGAYGNGVDTDVAVRSSATAEDLPDASFAGQQDTYLNVRGAKQLMDSVRRCIASLFTDRAISYRADKGFSHMDVALSVGVQKMVRSDKAGSGIMFTLDTETGYDGVIVISSTWGLGELIVQGRVIPDEFMVWKPGLVEGKPSIIERRLSNKKSKMIYTAGGIKEVKCTPKEALSWSLTNNEVLELAGFGKKIEEHFSQVRGKLSPMDIEWAKDGVTGKLFIVQARPETVIANSDKNVIRKYILKGKGKVLLEGAAVGNRIGAGVARIIKDAKHIGEFKKGEVLVTEMTDPDWEPIMKIASAIITDKGGRTSHAAIVSRELGIPCVVGTEKATKTIKTGRKVTVDCSAGQTGTVYDGILPFDVDEEKLTDVPATRTHVMINVGSPDEAFKNHALPASGVGLGRLEFIIASHIGIHPNALIAYPKIADAKLKKEIEARTAGYAGKKEYYVEKVAQGVARIAAAFHPHDVIIRFSDFKTNEYRKLLGGESYEPAEENPMLGWRGASRYYDPKFTEAFGLECKAIKCVREVFGLTNVVPMIPFCRTVEEGKKVIEVMKRNGLDREVDKTLRVYVMCEIPSNVLLADQFLDIFDGMSIGSNDLTQLTLGLDRDSGIVSGISNENNEAVKMLIVAVIDKCKERGKYIGICGQAPSDYPDFAALLVKHGIESISLNPDVLVTTIKRIAAEESKQGV
ncbi:MAG TPA: phosphoenolpyruvate synthase [Candidatus Paceibacterota bacterium]